MHPTPAADRPWSTFRRVFLWTLAAFALLWSLRADAAPTDAPTLIDPPPEPQVQVRIQPAVIPAPTVAPPSTEVSTDVAGSSVTHFAQDDWTVTILPSAKSGATVNGRKYEDVYASIPYRRTEYLANPGYRHEATMEVLFGQLRPKTVVSNYTPQTVQTPTYSVYKPFLATQTYKYRNWRPSLAPYSWGFPVAPYYPSYQPRPMLY